MLLENLQPVHIRHAPPSRQSQGSTIHNGGGAADEKDPTVIKGQEPSSTAEEVQKLQKASDPDSNDSYETPGAQPTSPHTSCDPQMRDAGLIDALNDLSLEELKSFGLDKPFDDSKLTAEVVHRLKALRLERQAAPGGKEPASTKCSSVHLTALLA